MQDPDLCVFVEGSVDAIYKCRILTGTRRGRRADGAIDLWLRIANHGDACGAACRWIFHPLARCLLVFLLCPEASSRRLACESTCSKRQSV